jgi:hypothetical protein
LYPSSLVHHGAGTIMALARQHDVEVKQSAAYVVEQLATRRRDAVLMVSDGGADHCVSYETVELCLLSVALALGLQFPAALRTCAGQSYTNPAERVMPILNLGLYGVALMRARNDDDQIEKKLASLGSMADVRTATEGNGQLRAAYEASVDPVLKGLCTRFSKLKLKGVPVVATATPMAHMQQYLMRALDQKFPLPSDAKHEARMQ